MRFVRRAVAATAKDAESSASSSVYSPLGGTPYVYRRAPARCVGRHSWPGWLSSWRWLSLRSPLAASALPRGIIHAGLVPGKIRSVFNIDHFKYISNVHVWFQLLSLHEIWIYIKILYDYDIDIYHLHLLPYSDIQQMIYIYAHFHIIQWKLYIYDHNYNISIIRIVCLHVCYRMKTITLIKWNL